MLIKAHRLTNVTLIVVPDMAVNGGECLEAGSGRFTLGNMYGTLCTEG